VVFKRQYNLGRLLFGLSLWRSWLIDSGGEKHRWREAPRNHCFPSFELMKYELNF
jgi:hypothetical protein